MMNENLETFLAHDESNNGQFPEIHIMTLTQNKIYTHEKTKLLRKGKEDKEETIEKAIYSKTDVDFHFIIIYKNFLKSIQKMNNGFNEKTNKQILILSSFITHLKENHGLNNYKLLIDGMSYRKEIEKISKEYQLFNKPKFYNKGDKRIPLINMADRIAYAFYNEIINKKEYDGLINDYYEKRVYPKMSVIPFFFQ